MPSATQHDYSVGYMLGCKSKDTTHPVGIKQARLYVNALRRNERQDWRAYWIGFARGRIHLRIDLGAR